MAILDRELRLTRQGVASLWPAQFATPLLATVSLLDDAAWKIGPGTRRVRAKTSSAMPRALALERLSQLTVPVLLDFNCGAWTCLLYTSDAADEEDSVDLGG